MRKSESDSEAVELDESSIEQDIQDETIDTINIINNVYGDDDFSFEAQNEMTNSYKIIEYAKEE
jgi:hypothetical protein